MAENVLIIGAGPGISASMARRCAREGMSVAIASRNTGKNQALAEQIAARSYACDAVEPEDVAQLFARVDRDLGELDLVVFNPSYRVRGPFTEVDAEEVRKTLLVSCYAGFLVGQAAAKRMVGRGRGTILFTGASASVKGYPQSASFAMGKFGLRGLAQSMARELAPKNVHVAHFVIDGGVSKGPGDPRQAEQPDSLLSPDAIADTYWHVYRQPRSAWTWEIELRPWLERF